MQSFGTGSLFEELKASSSHTQCNALRVGDLLGSQACYPTDGQHAAESAKQTCWMQPDAVKVAGNSRAKAGGCFDGDKISQQGFLATDMLGGTRV